MYEIYVTNLESYWEQHGCDTNGMVEEFKAVLSEHYNQKIDWEDKMPTQGDDCEMSVFSLELDQLDILQACAAQHEMGQKVDLKQAAQDCDAIFEQLEEYMSEEKEPQTFSSIICIRETDECIFIPTKLPSVVILQTDEDEEEGECCGKEGCGCCCEADGTYVLIGSLSTLKKELETLAPMMGIDPTQEFDLEDPDVDFGLTGEDYSEEGIVAWHVLYNRVKKALALSTSMVIQFNMDDLEDEDEDEDEE